VKSFNIIFSVAIIICVSLFGFSNSYDVEYMKRLEVGKSNNHNLSISSSKKITALEIYSEDSSKINCYFDNSVVYSLPQERTTRCLTFILPNNSDVEVHTTVAYAEEITSNSKPFDYKIHVYRVNYTDLKELNYEKYSVSNK